MARSVGGILLLATVLSFTRADERAQFRNEHERRWNTPPELTPESVVKMSSNGEPQARLLSLIPVTATISLNAGHNNAHSVSLGASLDGISLSESNSYNHPAGFRNDGSSVSVSKSTSVSAGLSGISTSGAKAYSNGNDAKTESHSLSFGQAAASSFGVVENGQAITGAASSVGISQSSAVSGASQGTSFSQVGAASVQYPNRPTWNNVGPSRDYNDRRVGRPTLTISKPHDGRRPTLSIETHDTSRHQQTPTIHIYKWQSDQRGLPRPSLSIEHDLRPHESWNGQSHGSPSLQVGVVASPYGFSASDSASQINTSPLDFASSSSSQAHTSEYAQSHAQSFASFSHRNADGRTQSSASSGYVSGDSYGEGHAKGTSASGYRGGSSVAQVNAQASGNGHVQGIASSEAGSFVRFPEGRSAQAIPLRHVGGEANSRKKQSDSDIISELAQAVGELFDVV
ncbi:uncharacterized protein LOC116840328 [Odontomachus brunneus]|uniref:uncharacterized protein LOC116840328 n=1 Tax=Odontomachus brunneus TaxID=486640 RepID=UPI0013F1D34D|nr:uncharacterized protein LOC116840328 [Odontomachus brunneus]